MTEPQPYRPVVVVSAECLKCGKVTRDEYTLEVMNDLDPTCGTCGIHHIRWTLQDGSTVETQEDED